MLFLIRQTLHQGSYRLLRSMPKVAGIRPLPGTGGLRIFSTSPSGHDTPAQKKGSNDGKTNGASDGIIDEANCEILKMNRLDVAIVGMPNAGKSQLLNVVTKTPSLAAVSRKRHTTRTGILGARTFEQGDKMLVPLSKPPTQLIFVDTPGFLKLQTAKEEALFRSLVMAAKSDVIASDIALLVIDAAKRLTPDLLSTYAALMLVACVNHAEQLKGLGGPTNKDESGGNNDGRAFLPSVPLAIVLNKVDLVNPKTKLIDIAHEMGLLAEMCWNKADEIVNNDIEEQQEKDEHIFLQQILDGEIKPEDMSTQEDLEQQPSEQSEKEEMAKLLTIKERDEYCPVFMVSALHDDGGVDDILSFLINEAVPGEWDMEAGQVTEMSPQERVAEILREKIYRSVHKEVPHSVTQVSRRFEHFNVPPSVQTEMQKEMQKELPTSKLNFTDWSKILRVEQELQVQTKSHHRILTGKNGSILRRIQQQAQTDLEIAFNCRVFLELRVKIRKNANMRIQEEGFQDASGEDDDDNDQQFF
jgi:GTP-binding protein Era